MGCTADQSPRVYGAFLRLKKDNKSGEKEGISFLYMQVSTAHIDATRRRGTYPQNEGLPPRHFRRKDNQDHPPSGLVLFQNIDLKQQSPPQRTSESEQPREMDWFKHRTSTKL